MLMPAVPIPRTAVVIQPSYIPWRGYFDLMRRADVFVFYDDVQYDKHGWRNRNLIKTPEGVRWLTIPVHAKGNTTAAVPINAIRIDWTRDWASAHLARLRQLYTPAPHFRETIAFVESLYSAKPQLLADFTIDTTLRIATLLGIETKHFIRSSTLDVTGSKTDRLLDTLSRVGATHYISGPSAANYIDIEKFAERNISLEYIDYSYPDYTQLYPPFKGGVSVLDLIFMQGSASREYLYPRDRSPVL